MQFMYGGFYWALTYSFKKYLFTAHYVSLLFLTVQNIYMNDVYKNFSRETENKHKSLVILEDKFTDSTTGKGDWKEWCVVGIWLQF